MFVCLFSVCEERSRDFDLGTKIQDGEKISMPKEKQRNKKNPQRNLSQ